MVTILICGSRELKDKDKVESIVEDFLEGYNKDNLKVIHGGADGVDTIASEFIERKFPSVGTDTFEPEYDKFEEGEKYRAPLERNSKMVSIADEVLAIWDGESSGTKDTISKAREEGLEVEIEICDNRNYSLSDFIE